MTDASKSLVTIIGSRVPRSSDPLNWHLAYKGYASPATIAARLREELRVFAHVKAFADRTLVGEALRPAAASKRTEAMKLPVAPRPRRRRSPDPPRQTTFGHSDRTTRWNFPPYAQNREQPAKDLPEPSKVSKRDVLVWKIQAANEMPGAHVHSATSQDSAPERKGTGGDRPCPCAGSNENCYHCWGTGTIKGGSLAKPPMTQAPKKLQGPLIVIPPTPPSTRFAGPRSISQPSPIRRSRAMKKRAMAECPTCGCPIKASRLASHLRRVHAHEPNVRDAHEGGPVTFGPQAPPDEAVKRQSGNTSKGFATIGDAMERQLDATKPSAWTSRERGRFGSHPSHDDYSDEWKP